MRIAILLLAIIAMGCNEPKQAPKEPCALCGYDVRHDTIHTTDIDNTSETVVAVSTTHLQMLNNLWRSDSTRQIEFVKLQKQCDSLKLASKKINCDSLRSALKVQNFRVNRIKYYVNICNRKPSQDKFLRGWINRALQ